MKGELGGLANHAGKQAAGRDQQDAVADFAVERHLVDLGNVERFARSEEQHHDANQQADVTGASGEERLEGGVGVVLLFPPVTDEKE